MIEQQPQDLKNIDETIEYPSFVGMNFYMGTRFGVSKITAIDETEDYIMINYGNGLRPLSVTVKKDQIKKEGNNFYIKSSVLPFAETGTHTLIITSEQL